MQSSTVTSARTLLMLVCMIVLPVLAVMGTGWTRYLDFGSKADVGQPRAAVPARQTPTSATQNSGKQPTSESSQVSATALAVNGALAPAPPWNGETAAASPPSDPTAPSAVVPVASNAPTRDAPDWFTTIQQRLRGLGATYYLLETWGTNGELYRFHCKMAVAGNQGFTRHFEATDSSAARAMQSVLEQVERWRSGKLR